VACHFCDKIYLRFHGHHLQFHHQSQRLESQAISEVGEEGMEDGSYVEEGNWVDDSRYVGKRNGVENGSYVEEGTVSASVVVVLHGSMDDTSRSSGSVAKILR